MDGKQLGRAFFIIGSAVLIGSAIQQIHENTQVERLKRQDAVNQMGLDIAAIASASDIITGRIERGEIRSLEKLREAFNEEVAFQKIAIREN